MSIQDRLRESARRVGDATAQVDVEKGSKALVHRHRRSRRAALAGSVLVFAVAGSLLALAGDARDTVGTADDQGSTTSTSEPSPAPGRIDGLPTGQGPSIVFDADGNELFRFGGERNFVEPYATLYRLILDDQWLRDRAGTAGQPATDDQLRLALEDAGLHIETAFDPKVAAAFEEQRDDGEGLEVYERNVIVVDRQRSTVVAVGGSDAIAPVQPGLAFAPIVVAAAVDNGVPTDTLLPASRQVTIETGEEDWVVEDPNGNDDQVTMAGALVRSSPTAIASLYPHVSAVDVGMYARRFGFTTATFDDPVPSTLLGSNAVTLLELAQAYQAFAGDGTVTPVVTAVRATDPNDDPSDGVAAYGPPTYDLERAITPATREYVAAALRDAVVRGTARDAAPEGHELWGTIAQASTGDAWFVGWNADYIIAVRVHTSCCPSVPPGDAAALQASAIVRHALAVLEG